MYVFPFQSHGGPQQKVQWAVKENYHPGESPWGSACPSGEATINFSSTTYGRFQVSPRARAGTRVAAVEDEGVGHPSWGASQSTARCRPPPRSLSHSPWCYLSTHVQLNMPGSPHIIIVRTQAVGMKSLQTAERPADLVPVRFNC
jgi:hypothetical protein